MVSVLGWPTMPTGAIPTPKNNNPDKKVPTMLTTAIPTLIPTPIISTTAIPNFFLTKTIPTTYVNCG
jgi:hypothetical protein